MVRSEISSSLSTLVDSCTLLLNFCKHGVSVTDQSNFTVQRKGAQEGSYRPSLCHQPAALGPRPPNPEPTPTAQKPVTHPESSSLPPTPRDYDSGKMGPPRLVLHLPSYAGVQEALEFLDISVRRVFHLESFLQGRHVCVHRRPSPEESAEDAASSRGREGRLLPVSPGS